jgi:hypothetical protein
MVTGNSQHIGSAEGCFMLSGATFACPFHSRLMQTVKQTDMTNVLIEVYLR